MNQYPILSDLGARRPELTAVLPSIQTAFELLAERFRAGGTLFLCGNGGSMSDALHISGELLKSFALRRRLDDEMVGRLQKQPDGDLLARNLQPGLRTVVLGANVALGTAVANDMPDRDMNLAQELLALARSEDVLMGISTSGNARNIAYAAQTARALGLPVIGLSGQSGGCLAQLADVAICVPEKDTALVQELHISCYHALCLLLEEAFFKVGA
jgi:D-sedoheptulose 7-phosphate isomerase